VDGNTNPVFSAAASTHTNNDAGGPWWKVDLAGSFVINRVDVYNRQDCCSERLSNVIVDLMKGGAVVTTKQWNGAVAAGAVASFKFDDVVADTVRVRLPTAEYLTLPEVVVNGKTATQAVRYLRRYGVVRFVALIAAVEIDNNHTVSVVVRVVKWCSRNG
jgi:hypothetical protein